MEFFSKFRKKPSSAVSTLSITANISELDRGAEFIEPLPEFHESFRQELCKILSSAINSLY